MTTSCLGKMDVSAAAPNCVSFQNTAKKHETSTGKCHRFIPQVPQEFDCVRKANNSAYTKIFLS